MLLIDDDDAQREVVTEILELEGVEVLNAPTASEAISLLDRGPDIVLMDLHGVATEQFVPVLDQRADRPALLLLSGDVRLAHHAQKLRADGYLAKPYDLDELLEAVTTVLEKRDARGAQHPAP